MDQTKQTKQTKYLLSAAISGVVFGLGLILAGMANPAKVLAFLDIAGQWDPSLMCVMGGAIAATSIGVQWMKRRKLTLFNQEVPEHAKSKIDLRLIAGSMLFGIGWGIAGICPGPAFVLIGLPLWKGVVFVIAMLLGMQLHQFIESKLNSLNSSNENEL